MPKISEKKKILIPVWRFIRFEVRTRKEHNSPHPADSSRATRPSSGRRAGERRRRGPRPLPYPALRRRSHAPPLPEAHPLSPPRPRPPPNSLAAYLGSARRPTDGAAPARLRRETVSVPAAAAPLLTPYFPVLISFKDSIPLYWFINSPRWPRS
jgi:hypothetical protein